eukprot:7566229-Alexandrium_andersonii.AAC.1
MGGLVIAWVARMGEWCIACVVLPFLERRSGATGVGGWQHLRVRLQGSTSARGGFISAAAVCSIHGDLR